MKDPGWAMPIPGQLAGKAFSGKLLEILRTF